MQITLPAKLEWWWNSNWNAADYQTAVDASYAIYNATLWLFHKQNAFTWDWKERASQWFFGLLNIPSRYWQWYSWNVIKSRWLVTQYGDLKANVYTYKFNNTINSLNGQIYWSVRRSNGYSYVTYWDTNWAEYIDSNQNINTIPDPSWNHVRWNRWVKVATGTKHYLVGAEVSTAGTVASNIIAFECNENWAIINTTRIVIYTSFLYSFYSWTRWWVVTADVPICAVWNTIYTWTVCVVRHTNNTSYSPASQSINCCKKFVIADDWTATMTELWWELTIHNWDNGWSNTNAWTRSFAYDTCFYNWIAYFVWHFAHSNYSWGSVYWYIDTTNDSCSVTGTDANWYYCLWLNSGNIIAVNSSNSGYNIITWNGSSATARNNMWWFWSNTSSPSIYYTPVTDYSSDWTNLENTVLPCPKNNWNKQNHCLFMNWKTYYSAGFRAPSKMSLKINWATVPFTYDKKNRRISSTPNISLASWTRDIDIEFEYNWTAQDRTTFMFWYNTSTTYWSASLWDELTWDSSYGRIFWANPTYLNLELS